MVRVKQPGRCEPALRAGVPTYHLHYTHARLGAWEAASKCGTPLNAGFCSRQRLLLALDGSCQA